MVLDPFGSLERIDVRRQIEPRDGNVAKQMEPHLFLPNRNDDDPRSHVFHNLVDNRFHQMEWRANPQTIMAPILFERVLNRCPKLWQSCVAS